MGSRQRVARAAPWLAVLLPLVNAGLAVTGALSVRTAVVVAVVGEVLLLGVAVAEWTLARRAYLRSRAAGGGRGTAVLAGLQAALPPPVYRLVRSELAVVRALGWAARRRTVVRPGEEAFSYTSRIGVLLGVMIGLTPVEMGVVHVLLPWPTVRWVVFGLGLAGLCWLVGFVLSLRQHPHTLDDSTLTLRFGQLRTARVQLADVLEARAVHTDGAARNTEVSADLVALSVTGETTVRLTLRPGAALDLDGETVPTAAVALFADDPRRLVRELRTRLAARVPEPPPR